MQRDGEYACWLIRDLGVTALTWYLSHLSRPLAIVLIMRLSTSSVCVCWMLCGKYRRKSGTDVSARRACSSPLDIPGGPARVCESGAGRNCLGSLGSGRVQAAQATRNTDLLDGQHKDVLTRRSHRASVLIAFCQKASSIGEGRTGGKLRRWKVPSYFIWAASQPQLRRTSIRHFENRLHIFQTTYAQNFHQDLRFFVSATPWGSSLRRPCLTSESALSSIRIAPLRSSLILDAS